MSSLAIDPVRVIEACGSRSWQEAMRSRAPFASLEDLLEASAAAFASMSRTDWLDAFAAHSMIGTLRPGDASGASEQAGMAHADGELRTRLAAANIDYRERFGFVFLIRARGRSAAEMLDALERRLDNPREVEFLTACSEQREITTLRLRQLGEQLG